MKPFAIFIFLLCAICDVRAQSTNFPKGTWDLEIDAGYVQPIRFSEDRLYDLNVGIGYYLVNDFSFTLQLQASYVDQPTEDAGLGAAIGIFRWHIFHFDRLSLYLDGGGGVSMADPEVPEFGTHFNFIGEVGPGASWRLKDDVFLLGGVRYFHLSNGNLHGRDQNPSFDGINFYVGVMFRLN